MIKPKKKNNRCKLAKQIVLISIIFLSTVLLNSCSSSSKEDNSTIAEIKSPVTSVDSTPTVEVTTNQLVGFWEYSEVRTNPKESGTPPVGEILLGITENNELTFATTGIDELKENLKTIPTIFEIRGNSLYPKDKVSIGDFKISFNNVKTTVFLLNENELILGKGVLEKDTPVLYMYFKRKTRK